MSRNGKEGLLPCLFSRQGMMLDNIRFFRGDAKVIKEADFRDALCEAEERKRAGKVKPCEPPSSGREPHDVREWVESVA